MLETPVVAEAISPEQIEYFMAGLQTLTPSEKQLFEAYIARLTTKEIMANMNIKESTVKYHSRNLYAKLGVANRKELLELHKQIKSVKAQLGETGTVADKSIESNSWRAEYLQTIVFKIVGISEYYVYMLTGESNI